MPPWGPVNRRILIQSLRALGWEGPLPGGRHQAMRKADRRISIPNDHGGVISVGLVARVLRAANITRDEWESV